MDNNNNSLWYIYILYILTPIEKLSTPTTMFYYTNICIIEIYTTMNLKFIDPKLFLFDKMSHFGSVVKIIIINIL